MKAAIARWAFYLAALLVFGPLAGMLLGHLRGADGGESVTPLLSTRPAAGVALGLGALLIALVLGAVAARVVGALAGMSTAGLVVAWASFRTGTVDELIRRAGSGRPLVMLSVEGLIFGVGGVALTAALWAAARRKSDPQEETRLDATALGVLAAAVVAGGIGAAFLAGSPLKGQAVAAAVLGGVAAGAAMRLLGSRLAGGAMLVPMAALAVLGPLGGIAMAGRGVVQATYRGSLFPLAWILPLDWVAGGLLGVPLGLAWAGSMMEKRG